MSKLYGYKEKDVIGFTEFLKGRKGETLTESFSEYAKLTGKAKGTIRNMYYAMARKSTLDEEFKNNFLMGENFSVNKPKGFSDEEYNNLIKYILNAKKEGKSVRKATAELAKGDIKLALRYQNKYRNAVKTDENLRREISVKKVKEILPEQTFSKLKSDINSLVNSIALKEKKQNEYLKNRVFALEMENARLSRLLYGEEKGVSMRFFNRTKKDEVIN